MIGGRGAHRLARGGDRVPESGLETDHDPISEAARGLGEIRQRVPDVAGPRGDVV